MGSEHSKEAQNRDVHGYGPAMAAAASATFRYGRIDAKRQIRLFTLNAGTDPSSIAITGRLDTYSLKSAPPFMALSYCWGDEAQKFNILVGSRQQPIQVTRNLYTALLHLRNAVRQVTLWIDAVCIDQRSVREKNGQVPLMGQIYARAEGVISWVGEGDDKSFRAFELVRAWNASKQIIHGELFRDVAATTPSTYTKPDLPTLINELFHPESWAALSRFFHVPYWKRMWIIQEVVLGREVHVQYGPHRLGFSDLMAVLPLMESVVNSGHDDLGSSAQRALIAVSGYENLRPTFLLTGSKWNKPSFYLPTLLLSNRAQACKDPRDKLYAVLAIAELLGPADQRWTVVPDYSLPIADIYVQFTAGYITQTGNLDLVPCAGINDRPGSRLDLPSWVADLEHQGKGIVAGISLGFNAGKARAADCCVSPDLRELHTAGKTCDRIVATVGGDGGNLHRTLIDWARAVRRHPTRLPWVQQIFRTIIHDSHDAVEKAWFDVPHEDRQRFFRQGTGFCYLLANTLAEHGGDFAAECVFAHGHAPLTEKQLVGIAAAPLSLETIFEKLVTLFSGTPGKPYYMPFPFADVWSEGAERQLSSRATVKTVFKSEDLFITAQGYLGVGRKGGFGVGDYVCVLPGCRLPLLARNKGDHWMLLGDCYVYGMMYGEMMAGMGIQWSPGRMVFR